MGDVVRGAEREVGEMGAGVETGVVGLLAVGKRDGLVFLTCKSKDCNYTIKVINNKIKIKTLQ